MLIGILGSMAIFQIGSARPAMVADGAMRTVMGQLNLARETAVAQRRQIDVVCDEDKHVLRLIQTRPAAGRDHALAETPFEGGVRFGLARRPPRGHARQVRQGPRRSISASAQTISFNSDGMLIDGWRQPRQRHDLSHAAEASTLSLRAVTVLGSIGRVRGYRWNGKAWTRA